jgi:hypothetical protein
VALVVSLVAAAVIAAEPDPERIAREVTAKVWKATVAGDRSAQLLHIAPDAYEAQPIDQTPLVIRGGVFTTFANRMEQEKGYNYWSRNIVISRSNTEVDGLTHYVVGETSVGHPYSGFLNVRQCADITLRNCLVASQ